MATVKCAIAEFFSNGVEFRREILVQFVHKLKRLLHIVQNDGISCRFYSTSLLLLYEGAANKDSSDDVDLRMIDFAHTFLKTDDEENDDGYVFGLTNLVKLLEEIDNESRTMSPT